ncbi:MAG: right-handed parallel beta-helix repeat-containing protein [Bacteroidales bacterium]|nr:right-handed parallel beta-helix repeat-containing protein [Bacteroidales bacterium]
MKRKQILLLFTLFMTVATGARAQEATTIVTQSNFYNYFDQYGNLLDAVTSDELIFQGEFADLVSYIIIDRALTVTGDNAVLNDMGFIIAGEGVTLKNMKLVANENLGNLIDIAGENAVIENVNITYTVDEAASAINVYPGANGAQILNNTIYFVSTVDGYAADEVTTAICVNSGVSIFDDDEDPITGLVIDGNEITAVIPAFLADIYEHENYVMGISAVNGVRINGAKDFEFTNNTLNVTTNWLDNLYPTFQAMYVASSSGLIDKNKISMIDEFTPAGEDVYLYALELVYDKDLTISNDTINISTAGGKAGAGAASAILAITSDFSVAKDSITTVSNGPNTAVYFPSNMGAPCDAVITDNFISVTGLATASEFGLVSGIEIQTGIVEIKGNTIYTYNTSEYADGNYIFGISYAQDGTTSDVEITDNTVKTEGRYAISFRKVDDAVITGNTLYAHELTGDDAVYIASGSGNTVENNLPDNPTGIKYIRTQNTDGTECYYDLNGRRIEKPTTKGIYIHNGRKELFK